MPVTILSVEALDIRFPTSRWLDGSDAMNPDPDYSAAYAVIRTSVDGLEGHGFTFTIGRGNDLCCAAIRVLAPLLVGRTLEDITADMGAFWRSLAGDSQLRISELEPDRLGGARSQVCVAGVMVADQRNGPFHTDADKVAQRLGVALQPIKVRFVG